MLLTEALHIRLTEALEVNTQHHILLTEALHIRLAEVLEVNTRHHILLAEALEANELLHIHRKHLPISDKPFQIITYGNRSNACGSSCENQISFF